MAKQTVGIGAVANDGTGDDARAAFDKINDNFNEVYTALGDGSSLTVSETIEDAVGAMVTGNTETRITVTYQDADGTLDFVVDNDLSNYDNTTSGFAVASTLASTANGAGASLIGIEDSAANITATTVEGALAELAAATGLADVVDDTTPQLGGNLDVNGNSIVSVSNGDITLAPNGTGDVVLGNFTLDADQTVGAGQDNYVLTYDNASGKIALEAAQGAAGGDAWSDAVDADIVPDADGTRDLGSGTNRFASLHVDSIDLNGTTLDGTTLADPGADRILFWDDSAGTTTYLTAGTGLSISGTTMTATGLADVVDDTTPQLGGDLDGQGNEIANFVNSVVTSASGTLTTAAHSGNVIKTSGNVTVPTTAGFTCTIIAGGAHTVSFNSTTSAAMAAGDVMTVVVESGTVIHAVLTASADKVSFS